jgi:hypothetical protein
MEQMRFTQILLQRPAGFCTLQAFEQCWRGWLAQAKAVERAQFTSGWISISTGLATQTAFNNGQTT